MVTEPKEIQMGSIAKAFSAQEEAEEAEQAARKQEIERAKSNRRTNWFLGLLLALGPTFIYVLNMFIYFGDTALRDQHIQQLSGIIADGSFLWLSVTVLVLSLADLLLCGFRKGVDEKIAKRDRRIVWTSIGIAVVGFIIYILNVAVPINFYLLLAISIVGFILYVIFSSIVSFKILREV